jgi:hypothetical protein
MAARPNREATPGTRTGTEPLTDQLRRDVSPDVIGPAGAVVGLGPRVALRPRKGGAWPCPNKVPFPV